MATADLQATFERLVCDISSLVHTASAHPGHPIPEGGPEHVEMAQEARLVELGYRNGEQFEIRHFSPKDLYFNLPVVITGAGLEAMRVNQLTLRQRSGQQYLSENFRYHLGA